MQHSKPHHAKAENFAGKRRGIGLLDHHAVLETDNVKTARTSAVLFQRNAKRETTLTQKDLERMLHRWEVPLPWEAHEVRYDVTDGVRSHTATR